MVYRKTTLGPGDAGVTFLGVDSNGADSVSDRYGVTGNAPVAKVRRKHARPITLEECTLEFLKRVPPASDLFKVYEYSLKRYRTRVSLGMFELFSLLKRSYYKK